MSGKQGKAGELVSEFFIDLKNPTNTGVFEMARHTDGSLYVGINVNRHPETGVRNAISIARLDENNKLDPDYGLFGVTTVDFPYGHLALSTYGFAMCLYDDGSVLVVVGADGAPTVGLARLKPDGNLDEGFGNNGIVVHDLVPVLSQSASAHYGNVQGAASQSASGGAHSRGVLLPSGKVLYAGGMFIVRFMPDGSLDKGFGQEGIITPTPPIYPSLMLHLTGITALSDNKFAVVGGLYEMPSNFVRGIIGKYTEEGVPDEVFGDNGFVEVRPPDEFVDPVWKIYSYVLVEGADLSLVCDGVIYGTRHGYGIVASFDRDGKPSPSFNNGKSLLFGLVGRTDGFSDVAIQSDNKIVAVGQSRGQTGSEFLVARFDPDGSRDLSFAGKGWTTHAYRPGTNGASAVLLDNGSIMAAGFSLQDQQAVVMIFRG